MRLTNTSERYGLISRLLHWTTVLCILAAVPLGVWAAAIGPGHPVADRAAFRDMLLFWHKSFGLSVLFLSLVRLGWTLCARYPSLPAHLPRLERIGAKGIHALLYLLLLALPLSGILLSQSVGFPASFFGLFDLPMLFRPDPAVPPLQRTGVVLGVFLHKGLLPYILYAALALHLAGLLKHQFLDRDPSIWRRMGGRPTTDQE